MFSGPMAGWPRVEMMPGALDTLGVLQSTWRLVLATNAMDSSEADVWQALGRVGLNDAIHDVFCFVRVGYRKPSPQFFAFVLRELQLDANQFIMVGDSFENDVVGANQAGTYAIWLNAGAEVREGKLFRTIHDLRELPSVLAERLV